MSSELEERDRRRLTVIHESVEARANTIAAGVGDWPCSKGCDACCRRLGEVPALVAAEWRLVWQGYMGLPASLRAEIRERVHTLASGSASVSGPGPDSSSARAIVCPFLDRGAGACLIYAHRPAACRMYGFYVSRGEGRYCEQIRQEVDEGEGADNGRFRDVIWGNHDAVEAELSAQFGQRISIIEWFAEHAD